MSNSTDRSTWCFFALIKRESAKEIFTALGRYGRQDTLYAPCRIRFLCFVFIVFFSACQITARTEINSIAENPAALQARNEAALLQAKNNIETHRKGGVRIRVLDTRGRAISRVRLYIKQISHDFKFGCYLKIDDLAPQKLPQYERHFAKLFNFATVGTYWDFIENARGNENWSWFERETALSRKLGARIEAAPILWGTSEFGAPTWLPRSRDELLPILENRVKSPVARYQTVVSDWEIINEPLAPKNDFFAQIIGREYVESAFLWAREVSPNERLLINEYGVFGSVAAHNYNRDKYFNLLDELNRKNVPFDVIGIQAHALGEWFEPADVAEQLDRYAKLGKPIQITEFSAQTLDYDDRTTPLNISGTYRVGVWDTEKQAEFYREFYTVSFGNPQVEAIVSWGLDDERAWLPGIGLIDENGNPKPAYQTLDRLINQEWKTNVLGVTDKQGVYNFRGFYGNYEIRVTVPTMTTETMLKQAEFTLEKEKTNEWIIRLNP
jgi:endo-1,4-beta-xylanase